MKHARELEVDDVLGEGGILQEHVSGFRSRRNQLEMARLIQQDINDSQSHVIEAARQRLLELEREAGAPAAAATRQLPLFDATPTPPPSLPDPLRLRLADVDPDGMNARQALELLYELCELRDADTD